MSPYVRTGSAPTPWKHLNLLLTRSPGISRTRLSPCTNPGATRSMPDSRNFDQGGYRIPDNGTMFRTDCKLISRSMLQGRALHWYEVTEPSLSNFNGGTPGHAETSSWTDYHHLLLCPLLSLFLSPLSFFPFFYRRFFHCSRYFWYGLTLNNGSITRSLTLILDILN